MMERHQPMNDPIKNIPDYDGIGVYALIAENGQRYIGSAVNIQRRVKQHNKKILDNTASRKLCGHAFKCVILEKLPFGTTPRQLIACEEKHINQCPTGMCLNEIKRNLTIWDYSRADTPIFPPRKNTGLYKNNMPKTQAELKNAYAKKAYDDVRLQVKKGSKQALQKAAEDKGLKLQGYIKAALKEQYRTDTGEEIEL